jgi:aldehyde:ferredoxin oxidoreductase
MNERHGLEAENLITIGPAGENLVRYAALMTSNSRAFGRGGLGAVLGSKGVKTVSFEGDSRPTVELPDGAVGGEIHRDAATEDHIMKRQGTTSGVDMKNDMDEFSLPTQYFERMEFDEGVELHPLEVLGRTPSARSTGSAGRTRPCRPSTSSGWSSTRASRG